MSTAFFGVSCVTLIVGIKSSDGIVVGADGAATFTSASGQPTIMQPVKKLTVIASKAILGVSGSVGLGQRLQPLMHDITMKAGGRAKGGGPLPPTEIMQDARQKIWPLLKEELHVAADAAKAIGNLAMMGAFSATLLAVPVSRVPCLFHFDQQGCPTEATDQMPFFSIGSGQQVADPFLAFIRRNLWAGKPPTIADGTFAAFWALDYAIQGAPNVGIGEPKQLVILESTGDSWTARELTDADLAEHRQSMEDAHESLFKFREGLAITPGEPPTTTTPPPSPRA